MIKEQIEQLDKIIEWFNNSDEFDVELASKKYQQAKKLLESLKIELAKHQDKITEIK